MPTELLPKNENAPKSSTSSSSSVASSLSSIPIKDLKRVLANTPKGAKKPTKTKTTTTTPTTPRTIAKTKSSATTKTKSKTNPHKPTTPQRKTAITPRKPRNNSNNKAKSKPSKVSTSDQLVNNDSTLPPATNVSPSILPKTKETTVTKHVEKKESGENNDDNDDEDDDEEDDDEEEAACCLCHCGVDCSDRALFFPKDRQQELDEDEDYYFSMSDPFFPETLYDQNNALVYCDSCNRLYHQKCHFVPVLVIPRGDWNCLLCSLTSQQQPQKQKQKPKSSSKQQPSPPWKKFCDESLRKHLFTSPPSETTSLEMIQELQEEFERVTAIPKAHLWQRQLSQLRTFLKSQASNLRLATAALQTLTSTKRNRAHFSHSKKSQELAQTLVRLATAKWKIRSALLSLEDYRRHANSLSTILLDWITTHSQYQSHVFPHGRELYEAHARTIPRTREMKEPNPAKTAIIPSFGPNPPSIPTEIAVPHVPSSKTVFSLNGSSKTHPPHSPKGNNKKVKTIIPVKKDNNNHDDDDKDDNDSGISLDDLKCCVCLIGDATDENDLLLCDGEGCCRAFHMKCVVPAVTNIDDEDWFCPLCCAISNALAEVQVACMEEDWEHRRMTEKFRHLETSSLYSWAKAEEVFPEAEWEYNTAIRLKEGKQDENTSNLLIMYLGEDAVANHQQGGGPMIGSDSEDENDYSLFDEKSFEERRRRERKSKEHHSSKDENENDDDDASMSSNNSDSSSTHSSQATLVEMSSVELEIDASELEALSNAGASSSSSSLADTSVGSRSDSNKSGADEAASHPSAGAAPTHHPTRRSRRLRKSSSNPHSSSVRSATTDLEAELDESNIIQGKRKRKRKRVDYQRLNDTLFGDLTPQERAKLDDVDDYEINNNNKKKNKDKKNKSKTTKTNGESKKIKSNGIPTSKRESNAKSSTKPSRRGGGGGGRKSRNKVSEQHKTTTTEEPTGSSGNDENPSSVEGGSIDQ